MKLFKRSLAVILTLCMVLGVVPFTAFASENTSAVSENPNTFHRIVHLDCGRKYFTADWIKALINEMAAAGYTHLELAFGNDGLRFLLDDMSVGSYTDEAVTNAVKNGNEAYNTSKGYSATVNELTQSEMDEIITHAQVQGIQIIPLLNNPGHMDAIVSAASSLTGSAAGYNGSASTVDLGNADAVSFVKGLVTKYITYFAEKGCDEFNMGADEYANDVYSSGSMGFGALVSAGKYQLFVNYVNDMAGLIKDANMVPIAFNDGIYFNKDTTYNFDTDIRVAFWTSGWTGYQSADASTMRSKGHEMINVHGNYYYVLGKNDNWDSNGYTYASNWSNTAFMGSNVSDPVGSMFCIWCDYPGAETETEIAENTRLILRAMAAEMQGNDGTAVDTDVVTGGFTEDGTINYVTVNNNDSNVSVTAAAALTGLTVAETTAPAFEGAVEGKVAAWDITPKAGNLDYTESGIVKLPVPAEWNTARITGFYIEDGEVVLVKGTYENGYYTFRMPHFSVAGIAETAYDHQINLTVGGSETVLIENVNLTGNTYTPAPAGIASVTTAAHNVAGSKELVEVTSAADIVSGGKYLIANAAGYILTSNSGSFGSNSNLLALAGSGNGGYKLKAGTFSLDLSNSHYWRIVTSDTESDGNLYNIYSEDSGNYLNFDYDSASTIKKTVGIVYPDIEIELYNSYYWFLRVETEKYYYYDNYIYLNNFGAENKAAGGYFLEDKVDNDLWKIYRIDETTASSGTDVTFNGTAVGETYVTINNEVYKIVVSHQEKTLNITKNSSVSDTQKAEITGEPSYSVEGIVTANVNGNRVTFSAGENLGTTVVTLGNTRYTINVIEFNITDVEPLTLELWITNSPASTEANGNVQAIEVQADAEGICTEAGVDVKQFAPETAYRGGDVLSYWRSRLLQGEDNHQIQENGVDQTSSGLGFTKIRYWNSGEGYSWQVLGGDTWQKVDLRADQLVAYYMQVTEVTDEVTTRVVDWGPQYGDRGNMSDWFWSGYVLTGKFIFIDFAVIYEDGTMSPSSFPNDNTVFFTADSASRSINGLLFTEDGEYEIWKVTATDGKSNVNYNSGVAINYPLDDADEEVTLWEIEDGGVPYITGFDNIPVGEGKLIRIYVRAVEIEDSLTVVYFDEKFGDTLYTYNISVPNGHNFNDNIVDATTRVEEDPPVFAGSTDRIDVTGYGIVNALDKTQNFQPDLTKVPEAVGKYRNELYTYTGSKILVDETDENDKGNTLILYYNINTSILSPNFVIDFGLPIKFDLDEILGEGTEVGDVDNVGGLSARYGTLTYDSSKHEFTYTPTTILQNIDVLSITLTIEDKANTTNVGITPATTVYYEEGFLFPDDSNMSGNWTGTGNFGNGTQAAEVLGDSTHYGYDSAYAQEKDAQGSDGTCAVATVTEGVGAYTSFTFTGTGFELYANSKDSSGIVTVLSQRGTVSKLYRINTVLQSGDTPITTYGLRSSLPTYYSLPIISETDLEYGTYTVQIKQNNTKDNGEIYIDGVRIINTIADSSVFKDDLEDDPDFYELRDYVLKAIGVDDLTSSDYIGSGDRDGKVAAVKQMAGQVYDSLGVEADGSVKDTAVVLTNTEALSNEQLQDILDNGPKNELYLKAYEVANEDGSTTKVNQSLTFKVNTNRVMQLGLKAPTASAAEASFELTVDTVVKNAEGVKIEPLSKITTSTKTLATTVDMFYKIADAVDLTQEQYVSAGAESVTHTVTITVNSGLLSVTKLKICDDPNAAFVALTQEDIENALLGIYGLTNDETPVEPEEPAADADAVLAITLTDGKKDMGTAELTAAGAEGESHTFTAEEILNAVLDVIPDLYKVADESAITDIAVKYGETGEITVDVELEFEFDMDSWWRQVMNLMNQIYTIIADAGEGGSITNEGSADVKFRKDITYTITPDEGYEIESVIVDGKDVGAVSEYTFRRVRNDHRISVVFREVQ